MKHFCKKKIRTRSPVCPSSLEDQHRTGVVSCGGLRLLRWVASPAVGYVFGSPGFTTGVLLLSFHQDLGREFGSTPVGVSFDFCVRTPGHEGDFLRSLSLLLSRGMGRPDSGLLVRSPFLLPGLTHFRIS